MENGADLAACTVLEREYWERFARLFEAVSPRKPEKGIMTLIRRARKQAALEGRPMASVLEEIYQGARIRTERRVALLEQCPLRPIADES